MNFHYPQRVKDLAKELGMQVGTIAVGKTFVFQGVIDASAAARMLNLLTELEAANNTLSDEMAAHRAAMPRPRPPEPPIRHDEPEPPPPPPPPAAPPNRFQPEPQPRAKKRGRRKAS